MLKCCVLRCTIYHLFRIQKFIYTRLLIAYFTPLAFKTFAFKDFVIIIKMILLILRIEFYVIWKSSLKIWKSYHWMIQHRINGIQLDTVRCCWTRLDSLISLKCQVKGEISFKIIFRIRNLIVKMILADRISTIFTVIYPWCRVKLTILPFFC